MQTSPPEVTVRGLVLWRLRREPHQQLVCRVSDFGGELALSVQNHETRQVAIGEIHPNIVSLVDRAQAVRQSLLAAGWRVLDPDTVDA